MSATALLVGGTGPTGPHLARGLLERGYDVTVFHSGRHETDELPDVEHFHGDPFSADGIAAALGDRRYDVAVATYGRVRLLAEALAGRCDQLLTVGGVPVYRGFLPPEAAQPAGMPLLARETAERVPAEDPPGAIYGVGAVRRTEDAVFALHEAGAFAATIFRYPMLYGPRNPHAWEWSTVWRVLDGRTWMALPDGGLAVHSRCGARNAAAAVLLALDRPEAAGGRAFNLADDDQFSLRQWIELILAHLGADLELVSVPGDLPNPGWALLPFRSRCSPHAVVDTAAIRHDLGYRDVQPAREGLAETVDWLVAHADEARANPTVIDVFDYAAEDRFRAAYDRAAAQLAEAGAPFHAIPEMPVPQTASGSRGKATRR